MKLVADLIFFGYFMVKFKVIRAFSSNKLCTLIYEKKKKESNK